jgi:hypothetical protein
MAEMTVLSHDAFAGQSLVRRSTMLFVRPLSAEDRRALRRLVRYRRPPLSFRARVLVLSDDGLSVPAIARMLGCCRRTVRRWIHAYHSCGLAGAIGRLRGRPPSKEEEEAPVSAMSASSRPARLVPAVPLSVPEIRRLLARLALSPAKDWEFVVQWSAFRRYKQALAMACHYKRRGATPPMFEQLRL